MSAPQSARRHHPLPPIPVHPSLEKTAASSRVASGILQPLFSPRYNQSRESFVTDESANTTQMLPSYCSYVDTDSQNTAITTPSVDSFGATNPSASTLFENPPPPPFYSFNLPLAPLRSGGLTSVATLKPRAPASPQEPTGPAQHHFSLLHCDEQSSAALTLVSRSPPTDARYKHPMFIGGDLIEGVLEIDSGSPVNVHALVIYVSLLRTRISL